MSFTKIQISLTKSIFISFFEILSPIQFSKNNTDFEKFLKIKNEKNIKEKVLDVLNEEIELLKLILQNENNFEINFTLSFKDNILNLTKHLELKEKVILLNWLDRFKNNQKILNDILKKNNLREIKEEDLFKLTSKKCSYYNPLKKNTNNNIIVIEDLEFEEEKITPDNFSEGEKDIKNNEKFGDYMNVSENHDDEKSGDLKKNLNESNNFEKFKIKNFNIFLPLEKIDEVIGTRKKKRNLNEKIKRKGKSVILTKSFVEKLSSKKNDNETSNHSKGNSINDSLIKKKSIQSEKNSLSNSFAIEDDALKANFSQTQELKNVIKKKNNKMEISKTEEENEVKSDDQKVKKTEKSIQNTKIKRKKTTKLEKNNKATPKNDKLQKQVFLKKKDSIKTEEINKKKNDSKLYNKDNSKRNILKPKDKKNSDVGKKYQSSRNNKNDTINNPIDQKNKKIISENKIGDFEKKKQKNDCKNSNSKISDLSNSKIESSKKKKDSLSYIKEEIEKKEEKNIIIEIKPEKKTEENKELKFDPKEVLKLMLNPSEERSDSTKIKQKNRLKKFITSNTNSELKNVRVKFQNNISKLMENGGVNLSKIENKLNSNIMNDNSRVSDIDFFEMLEQLNKDDLTKNILKENEAKINSFFSDVPEDNHKDPYFQIEESKNLKKESFKNFKYVEDLQNSENKKEINAKIEICKKKKLEKEGKHLNKENSINKEEGKENLKNENNQLLEYEGKNQENEFQKKELKISQFKKEITLKNLKIDSSKNLKENEIEIKRGLEFEKNIDIKLNFNPIMNNFPIKKLSDSVDFKITDKKIRYSSDKNIEARNRDKSISKFSLFVNIKKESPNSKHKSCDIQKKEIQDLKIKEKEKNNNFQFKTKLIVINNKLPIKKSNYDSIKINKSVLQENFKSVDLYKQEQEKQIIFNKESKKSIKIFEKNDHDRTLLKREKRYEMEKKEFIKREKSENLKRKKLDSIKRDKSDQIKIERSDSYNKRLDLSLSKSWNISNTENFINHSRKSSRDFVFFKSSVLSNNPKICFSTDNNKQIIRNNFLINNEKNQNIFIIVGVLKKIMIFNSKIEELKKKVFHDINFSLLDLFRLYDKNNNGIMNVENLQKFCYDMELNIKDKYVKILIEYLNKKEKNNYLNFKSFSKLLYPSLENPANLFNEFFKVKNDFYKVTKNLKILIKTIIIQKLKMIENISKSVKNLHNFCLKDFFIFLTGSHYNYLDINILKSLLKENNVFFIEEDLFYIFNEFSEFNYGFITLEEFEFFWNFFNKFNK